MKEDSRSNLQNYLVEKWGDPEVPLAALHFIDEMVEFRTGLSLQEMRSRVDDRISDIRAGLGDEIDIQSNIQSITRDLEDHLHKRMRRKPKKSIREFTARLVRDNWNDMSAEQMRQHIDMELEKRGLVHPLAG